MIYIKPNTFFITNKERNMAKRELSDESDDESEEEYSDHSEDYNDDDDMDSLMDNDLQEHDEDVSVASSAHRSEHDNFLGTQPDLPSKSKVLANSENELLNQNQDNETKESANREIPKKVSKLKLKAKCKDRKTESTSDKTTKNKNITEKKRSSSENGLVYDLTVLEDKNDDNADIPSVKNIRELSERTDTSCADENLQISSGKKRKTTLDEPVKEKNPDGTKKTKKMDSPGPSLEKQVPVTNILTDKASKVPKKKKLTFQKQVLSHLLTSLKPFTLKTLAADLKTTDTALHHLMLSLLDKQVVRRKEVGNKIKKEIYWIDIEKASKEFYGTTMSNENDRLQADVELKQSLQKEQDVRKVLSDFSSELSNQELSIQVNRLDEEVSQLQTRVQQMKDRIANASKNASQPIGNSRLLVGMKQNLSKKPLTKNQLKKNINSMRLEWKSRKDKCVDFVENFADAVEKKPKDIYKLLEVETDEMNGVKIPPKQPLDD